MTPAAAIRGNMAASLGCLLLPRFAAAVALVLVIAISVSAADAPLLHPRDHLPASSFAYVGDPARPATWKLPYRRADGSVDRRRLPLAIEAMIETYRGRTARVPRSSRHDVLETLARAADEIGRMPPGAAHPAPLYRKLAAALGEPNRGAGAR